MMLGMLATLAEYERELITERVNAGIAAAKLNGTKFGRPVNPAVVEEKLAIVRDARAKGRTAGTRHGWWAGRGRPCTGTNASPTRRCRLLSRCDMDALARWRILRLHVEDAIPLTVLAQETDVGLRTLQRWKKAYRAGGIDAPARRAGRSRNATHGAGAGGVH
jgi:hypothetical protein